MEVLNDRVNSVDSSSIDVSELQKKLLKVNDVVEEVVTFQHGGLNNSLDTMSEVVKEYSRGQEEIKSLRNALCETQKVLTAKKVGQTSLRDLWARRVEVHESLRLVKELEDIKVILKRFPPCYSIYVFIAERSQQGDEINSAETLLFISNNA